MSSSAEPPVRPNDVHIHAQVRANVEQRGKVAGARGENEEFVEDDSQVQCSICPDPMLNALREEDEFASPIQWSKLSLMRH